METFSIFFPTHIISAGVLVVAILWFQNALSRFLHQMSHSAVVSIGRRAWIESVAACVVLAPVYRGGLVVVAVHWGVDAGSISLVTVPGHALNIPALHLAVFALTSNAFVIGAPIIVVAVYGNGGALRSEWIAKPYNARILGAAVEPLGMYAFSVKLLQADVLSTWVSIRTEHLVVRALPSRVIENVNSTVQAVIAQEPSVETFSVFLIAPVKSGGKAIITILWGEDTSPSIIRTAVNSTHIIVVAHDFRAHASNISNAVIIGTLIFIVTRNRLVRTGSGMRIAFIFCAHVLIVTADRDMHATDIRITRIYCAPVTIETDDWLPHALSSERREECAIAPVRR